MKISELIKLLAAIRQEYGDVIVTHDLDTGDDVVPVKQVEYSLVDDSVVLL